MSRIAPAPPPERPHTCHAFGCTVAVPPMLFMCKGHWFMLPRNLRDAVWHHYRPGQELRQVEVSEAYLDTVDICIDYVARLEGLLIDSFRGPHAFLSNFHPSPITSSAGQVYLTVEHAYQAFKTTDAALHEQIRLSPTPGAAKQLGKKVPLREGWEGIKVDLMRQLLAKKFAEPMLRAKLLDTGQARLVEGNTWGDTFWGRCNGTGKNMLGRLLMGLRTELRRTA